MKKILKISLITGIFGLVILGASFSLAVGAPTGLNPCDDEEQPLSVLLDWNDQTVHHYELYYKRIDETNWTDRYPSISQYQVTGLSPVKDYQWYVVSCGDPECSDRAPSNICSFATEELELLPNDNGTNGGGIPIGLINPLEADTLEEAINAFINFLFFLAMAIAPILIIYAAFLLLTAAGDVAKIRKARQIILWTLVAVAIILLAKGLPSIIKGAMGG